MDNTNYIASIVKILERPNQTIFSNNICATKFRVQLPQTRNTRIVTLIFWGNLGDDIVKYYKINDYILIEGYLSINKKHHLKIFNKESKKIEIIVSKVYPFLLSQDQEIKEK